MSSKESPLFQLKNALNQDTVWLEDNGAGFLHSGPWTVLDNSDYLHIQPRPYPRDQKMCIRAVESIYFTVKVELVLPCFL